MASILERAGLNAALAAAGGNPVTFVTALKYNSDLVKAFNNMTFIYDPNWEYEQNNPTYPIAFFYVKEMKEIMTSDISKKPLLFYNASVGGVSTSVSGSAVNVITDNVIIEPKTYQLNIVIPLSAESMFQSGAFSKEQVTYSQLWINSNGNQEFMSTKGSFIANVAGIADRANAILSSLFKTLYGIQGNASLITNALCNQQDYNKASIEYMWRCRRIVKLKLYNGWRFKYLAIKSFETSKVGNDGDYLSGTLVCQEMPISAVTSASNLNTLKGMNLVSSVLGKGITKAVGVFIKAMETTAGNK